MWENTDQKNSEYGRFSRSVLKIGVKYGINYACKLLIKEGIYCEEGILSYAM